MANDSEAQLPRPPSATVDYQAAPGPPGAQETSPQAAPVKLLDAATFRDDGYLQEANRGFFHPLGLALAMTPEPMDGSVAILTVWDFREDPEGIRFEGGGLAQKAARVALLADARRPVREKALGYWQQPAFIPDTPPQGWEDSVAELLNEKPSAAEAIPGGPIQHFPRELDYVNVKLREKHEELRAGSFLGLFLCACLRADGANYSALRPVLKYLMEKYPAARELLEVERSDAQAAGGA